MMKKVVIAGSAKLQKEIVKWKDYFKSKNYEVIDYPEPINEYTFLQDYPRIHTDFFDNITKTDIFFLMNEDKNGIAGYIGAESFNELGFALAQNLLYNKKIELYVMQMPSSEVKCYDEIKLWLDLYWNIQNKHFVPVPDDTSTKTFTITKENYHIYSLFEKLYDDILNCNIFTVLDFELERCESEEEKQELIIQKENMNNSHKKYEQYKSLFHDNVIEWRSDDFPYDDASFVTVEKQDESFTITFNKSGEVDFLYQTYAIRFRNMGSRYTPFNMIFMRMYQELMNYDPDYHQVHIEEYLYQKRLEKKL